MESLILFPFLFLPVLLFFSCCFCNFFLFDYHPPKSKIWHSFFFTYCKRRKLKKWLWVKEIFKYTWATNRTYWSNNNERGMALSITLMSPKFSRCKSNESQFQMQFYIFQLSFIIQYNIGAQWLVAGTVEDGNP